jgi:hypothetical protein
MRFTVNFEMDSFAEIVGKGVSRKVIREGVLDKTMLQLLVIRTGYSGCRSCFEDGP